MSPSPHHGAPQRRHFPHANRHVSPRLMAGRSTVTRCARLTAEHRHVPASRRPAGDDGFSTAELLGNAALGIAALVAIWVVLEALGVSVVAWIGAQIGVSG